MSSYLQPIFKNIPREIKVLHQFVNWQAEERDGKITKPPYKPSGGYAKSNDPSTWSIYRACMLASKNYDGIGFVLTSDDPYIALDFDKCRCPAFNLIDPIVERHVKNIDSYTEISPSGRGLRVLVKASLTVSGTKKGSFEIYSSGRYVTLTGHTLPDYPHTIEKRQVEIDQFYKEVFTKKNRRKIIITECPNESFNPDERLIKALESTNGKAIQQLLNGDFSNYPSQSEADLALCSHLAFWLNGDKAIIDKVFRGSKLFRNKWDEIHFSSGETYGEHTIQVAVDTTPETFDQGQKERQHEPQEENTTANLTAFPPIISGAAGEFAKVYSSVLEAPEHFFFISYLTCLGNEIADKVTLKTEIMPQPRLYVLLLGESADDRKSTAISKTIDFFRSCLPDFNTSMGVGSAEGLQKLLEEKDNLLLCFDEFKQFVSKCKIDSSVLLPCVNTLFESNRYESRTKKNNIKIASAHLSILAASTISTYERTWDAAFTDIGFNNRLFLVPGSGKKQFSIPQRVSKEDWRCLNKLLFDVLDHAGNGLELDFTDEAKKLFHKWYMGLERSIHTKRLDTYAMRLMILLAVNKRKSVVDTEIVSDVIALCDWQLKVRRRYDPIDADTAVAKIEEKVRRMLKEGRKTERHLKRGVHVERTGLWAYNQAIKNLQGAQEINYDKKTKKWGIC